MVKLESSIERQLKRTVEGLEDKIMCLKFESPGMSGVPDRVILLPGGHTVFVELKQPGKHERARQEYVQQKSGMPGLPCSLEWTARRRSNR